MKRCGKYFEGFIEPGELQHNEIFVMGTNLAKIHGAGAAAVARKMGYPNTLFFGISHNCCGIPTKDENIQSMSLKEIKEWVDLFLSYSQTRYGKKHFFYVSQIGCGLAGNTVEEIAPIFIKALNYENIILCKEFYDYLKNETI